jgi:NAD(P)H-flavin reductase
MKLPEDISDKNFVLISTGSGLSPIYGIFSALLESNKYQNILHLHGEKSEQWFPEEQIPLLTYTNDKVSNSLCLSRQEEQIYPNQYNGYVTTKINEVFADWLQGKQGEVLCYICGKPEIVNEIIDQLVAFGIEKDTIKCEKY